MRRIGDEGLARVVELSELHAHSVERVRELSDLVVPTIDDRSVEVAAREAAGGGRAQLELRDHVEAVEQQRGC